MKQILETERLILCECMSDDALSMANHGDATESEKACIHFGFDVLHYDALYSYTGINNTASGKVAEKIGMKYEKEFQKIDMDQNNEEVLYTIKRPDSTLPPQANIDLDGIIIAICAK